MDALFKALADPTRREILRILRDGERSAGALAARFEVSAPSMSHHFSVLMGAQLISARRDGQQIFYTLNTTVFQDVMASVLDLISREPNPTSPGGDGDPHLPSAQTEARPSSSSSAPGSASGAARAGPRREAKGRS